MGNTTILPGPDFIHPTIAAKAFVDILHKLDNEVRGEMTMPSDAHDRLIALNTINNVMDRLEEAVKRHIRTVEQTAQTRLAP